MKVWWFYFDKVDDGRLTHKPLQTLTCLCLAWHLEKQTETDIYIPMLYKTLEQHKKNKINNTQYIKRGNNS